MSSSHEIDEEVGATANRYEILAKLATGGMAELFLARGASTVGVKRHVVLKRILREYATNKAFVRMFLDEATLVARLQHPNIAQVYDVGRLGESFFFTMEYVHGETVRALLQHTRARGQALPLAAVLATVAGAAAGLHHAHERRGIDNAPLGIVHRDVTPSNLMVSFEGNVKVVDFGVAKARDRGVETKSGTIKGKTAYLSPEQCKGAELDRRSDLFSLGIVMWEMLTTERLFSRGSEFDSMSAIVNEDAPAPSSKRGDLPKDVDAIVRKLLARDRDQRFQTAGELVEALEDVAAANRLRLSATTLAKVLRETFGERPEPWALLEAEARDAITVSATAASPSGANAMSAEQEAQLKKLPGLELVGGDDAHDDDDDLAIPRAPVVAQLAAAAHRSQRVRVAGIAVPGAPDVSDGVMAVMEDQPTARWSVVAPPDLRGEPPTATLTAAEPPTAVIEPEPPTATLPAAEPPVGPGKLALPLVATPREFPDGTSAGVDDDDEPEVEIARGSQELADAIDDVPRPLTEAPAGTFSARHLALAAAVGATVILGVVAIVMFARDGSSSPPPAPPSPAPVAIVAVDAAVAEVALDAEPAPEAPVDAALALPTTPTPPTPPTVAPTPTPRPRPPKLGKAELAKLYEQASYSTVVQACRGGAVATDVSLCVMAACRASDELHAKQWFASAPAKRRASLIQTCMSSGVALVGQAIPRTDP